MRNKKVRPSEYPFYDRKMKKKARIPDENHENGEASVGKWRRSNHQE